MTRTTRLSFRICLALLVTGLAAAPGAASSRVLPPNLVPLPPGAVWGPQTGPLPSFGYGYPAPPVAVSGCLADEVVRNGARRCLRFETVVVNQGRGPLELTYRMDGPVPGAYQILYRGDGTSRERFASGSEFHATHSHFHLRGFYVAKLWRASGEQGRPAARGEKSGFCPEDGAGPGQARYRCIGEYRTDELAVGQVVGISAGWSDSYRMHLPDQYIEITGLADGRYFLEVAIDPLDVIAESDENDNSACSLIELEGERVTLISDRSTCPGGGPRG